MTQRLVDLARAAPRGGTRHVNVPAGELELCLAYLNHDVSLAQVAAAAGVRAGNAHFWIGIRVLRALRGDQIRLASMPSQD